MRSDPDTIFVPSEIGTYRSTDGGRTWLRLEGPGINASIATHLALSTSAASGERLLWAVTGYQTDGKLHRRREGGRRWRAVGELRFQKVFASPSGYLLATTIEGVAWSEDDGVTWSEVEIAGSSRWEELAEIAFDPRDPERAYLARRYVGLQVTKDGGRSWAPIETPLGEEVFAVATDPDDPEVLYLGGEEGVTRSFDRGRTWEPQTLKRAEARNLFIDPHRDRTLWVLAKGCCFDQELYRSTDRGRTWKRVYINDRVYEPRIESFAIDPERPGHLYVGLYDECYRACGGVWRSTDDGRTWEKFNRGGLGRFRVHSVVVSPEGRLHAATDRRGVYSIPLGE